MIDLAVALSKIVCHPDVTGIRRQQVSSFVQGRISRHVLAPAPRQS
jgi:hypothetical protein